jgi:hypothetical protein
LRPKNIGARRCGQNAPTKPMLPLVSRNAIKSSPSKRTRMGAPSGSGSSLASAAGIQ